MQSTEISNQQLHFSFQVLSVSVCVTCNSSVAIMRPYCDFDSEIVWGFPRKIAEACKNVVTLGKTRHANARVVTSKWISGPPTCKSRETGRKTRHHILSCRHRSTICIWLESNSAWTKVWYRSILTPRKEVQWMTEGVLFKDSSSISSVLSMSITNLPMNHHHHISFME